MGKSPNIIMYGSDSCSYCHAARMLLAKKGLEYDEISIAGAPERFEEMVSRSGRRTVPQIIIGDEPIGGFDELYSLEQSGELDRMLGDGN